MGQMVDWSPIAQAVASGDGGVGATVAIVVLTVAATVVGMREVAPFVVATVVRTRVVAFVVWATVVFVFAGVATVFVVVGYIKAEHVPQQIGRMSADEQ